MVPFCALDCWQCLSLTLQTVSGYATVVPCHASRLLTMPVLDPPASEWLWCLPVFLACWQMPVFDPLDSECLCSVMPCHISELLKMLVLDPLACESLWCLAVFLACWVLTMPLQQVSGFGALLCFYPADNACPWLSSWWVAVVHFCVYSLLTMSILGFSACE